MVYIIYESGDPLIGRIKFFMGIDTGIQEGNPYILPQEAMFMGDIRMVICDISFIKYCLLISVIV